MSWWIGPVQFCGWDRGFFFQPIVIEFDFREVIPNHASKHTFMLPRFQMGKRKLLRGALPDGKNESYPVLSFYVCVNRGQFPPQDNMNELEWLTSRTERSKGLAHELLYGDQYAKNFDPRLFDPRSPGPTFDVQTPSPAEDEELLCPSYEVEALLHEIEARLGIGFKDASDFRAQQRTENLGKYYQKWLKKHAVDSMVCQNRTTRYLESGVRQIYNRMLTALKQAKAKVGIKHLDTQSLHRHMRDNSVFSQEYIRQLVATNSLQPFQILHRDACVASSKRAGQHDCKAAFHIAGVGCSACRCDITRHTKLLIERDGQRVAL